MESHTIKLTADWRILVTMGHIVTRLGNNGWIRTTDLWEY